MVFKGRSLVCTLFKYQNMKNYYGIQRKLSSLSAVVYQVNQREPVAVTPDIKYSI